MWVNWEALDNAEAYNVELLLNDETVASDVITNATTWTPEVTLQANTTYTYTVQGVGDGSTYAENNNPKAQSTVTTADYPAATLTLSENGITRDIVGKLNTPIDLPTTSTQTCEDKVFVGWSATTIDGETDTEPILLGKTYTFTNPEQLTATIYAVYATKQERDEGYVKVTSVTDGEYLIVNEASSRAFNGIDAANDYVDVTISNGTIADANGAAIIEIKAMIGGYSLKITNGDKADNYIYGKSGSNSIEYGATAVANEITFADGAATILSNDCSFRYNAASGNDRFRYYKTSTTGNSYIVPALYKKTQSITYSNYCTTFATKELTSISLSGEYPTEFWKGSAFSHEGMTVIAHYDDESTKDVTASAEFSGYNMATAGEQTVIVTYGTQSTTYDITVKTIANTPETAYTTAEAKELIDAGNDLGTEVYVKGTISKIDSYYSTYNSITYWLDDNAFEVYGGLLSNGDEKFSSKDDLSVGEFVIICGKIKKFNSTYELDSNNYLVNYTSAPMSITSAKLSTFIAPFPVEIPEGVQAYTAVAGTDAIEYTEVENVILACTPVVLYKDVTTTYSKICKGSSLATENSYKEGSLVGTLVDLTEVPTDEEGAPTYLLQNNGGKVGFYKTNSAKTYTLKANRAYLVGVNSVEAKDFFDFDGITPTGINEINVSKFPAEGIYDLNGRKLAVPQKGINIINGVKVIVK